MGLIFLMKFRAMAFVVLFFFSSASTSSAFEFSHLVAPFVNAVRFVGGLMPFGSERKAEKAAEVPVPEEVSAEPDQVLGTIRFAYDNFVLIYTPVKLNVPAGTKVTTLGKDGVPRGVELSLSDERKGAFLVADVISGQPLAGDLVVIVPGNRGATVAEYQVLE